MTYVYTCDTTENIMYKISANNFVSHGYFYVKGPDSDQKEVGHSHHCSLILNHIVLVMIEEHYKKKNFVAQK